MKGYVVERNYSHPNISSPFQSSFWTGWHTASLAGIVAAIFLINHFMPPPLRLWSWLGTLGLLTLFAVVAGHGAMGLWLGLLIDSRNKVSLSRLQIMAWTVMLLSAFLTAVLHNIDGGFDEPLAVTIPVQLWVLMGISTAALVGSPLLVQAKQGRSVSPETKTRVLERFAKRLGDPSKVEVQGQIVANCSPEDARLVDMFRGSETGNVGQLDLAKLQMFFVTLMLWLAYGAGLAQMFSKSVEKITELPTMDAGMLVLLTISHVGYLASKALPKGESEQAV